MSDRPVYREDRSFRDRDRYERPVTDRARDEVRSWFGDDEAERRRRMDEARDDRDWEDRAARSAEGGWDRARATARDWTDRDRDGRRGLAEFADNDRASYYSGYRPAYPNRDWNRARNEIQSRERGFGEADYNYTGRGPRGYQRSDDRIHEEVCDRLTDDPRIDASDIEVSVKGGELTLAGSVRTREEKRYAEDLAERLSGVREVNNSLKVKPSTEVIGTARSGASSVLGLTDTPPPQSRK